MDIFCDGSFVAQRHTIAAGFKSGDTFYAKAWLYPHDIRSGSVLAEAYALVMALRWAKIEGVDAPRVFTDCQALVPEKRSRTQVLQRFLHPPSWVQAHEETHRVFQDIHALVQETDARLVLMFKGGHRKGAAGDHAFVDRMCRHLSKKLSSDESLVSLQVTDATVTDLEMRPVDFQFWSSPKVELPQAEKRRRHSSKHPLGVIKFLHGHNDPVWVLPEMRKALVLNKMHLKGGVPAKAVALEHDDGFWYPAVVADQNVLTRKKAQEHYTQLRLARTKVLPKSLARFFAKKKAAKIFTGLTD